MHEVSIMAEAVRLAVESAEQAGARQVRAVRLRVGALNGLMPDAMLFAWDIVIRDTMAEGARLEIESAGATGWCPECRFEFDCRDFFDGCPKCQSQNIELRRGREVEITSVEID